MTVTSEKLTQASLAAPNTTTSFEYPEAFVVITATIIISFQDGFSAYSSTLLVLVVIPCLLIIWLSYRKIKSYRLDVSTASLMAIVTGTMQLYSPILFSFSLLIGIRYIRTKPEYRISIIITVIMCTAIFYFFSVSLNVEIGSTIFPYANLVAVLSVIAALWQFAQVYDNAETYYDYAYVSKSRIKTMVTVINKLTRFLPPQVWQPIVQSNIPVVVINKRRKLSVMFSDIAGFTELSERLSSDEVADVLNTYMQRMTDIAEHHGAVLDKFVGDGMVCFFGAPDSNGVREDALACVSMAIDMRREMRTLRHQWRLQGFEGLDVRIGITTGYCHVGNFGSNSRMSYTLIGSEANLASRLESAANKGAILVSQSTYDYICHEYVCRFEGPIKLKGFSNAVKTYTVLDPNIDQGQVSKWVDYDLPGFNLHLNFKDIRNYDYHLIKEHLEHALEHINEEEKVINDTDD